jgi:hypothetical protein
LKPYIPRLQTILLNTKLYTPLTMAPVTRSQIRTRQGNAFKDVLEVPHVTPRDAPRVQKRLFTGTLICIICTLICLICVYTPILMEDAMLAIYEYTCVNSTEFRMVQPIHTQFYASFVVWCIRSIAARYAVYRERLSDLFEWARMHTK